MPEKEKKEQNIVAYISNPDKGTLVLSYAATLSKMFNKPLLVLFISDKRYNPINENIARSTFEQLKHLPFLTDLQVSYHFREGKTAAILETDTIFSDTTCLITSVDKSEKKTAESPKEVLQNCKNLRMAYLLVQEAPEETIKFNNVALSIDFEREAKEKTTWASFFGRFCQSKIHIYHYKYKDEYLSKKLNNNLFFLERIFENVEFQNYSIQKIAKTSSSPDIAALQNTTPNKADLLIALSTKQKGLSDFVTGTTESKLIVNDYKTPILLINPREDLYVICN